MNIQSTTAFSPLPIAPTPTVPASAAAAALGSNSAPTESMFLQLLVAQLKNQDPSSPSDPSQFVGELAQFSQLEQTIQIAKNTTTLADAVPAATTPDPSKT
jgi:flagellar basal-body rod modification protein FlgD